MKFELPQKNNFLYFALSIARPQTYSLMFVRDNMLFRIFPLIYMSSWDRSMHYVHNIFDIPDFIQWSIRKNFRKTIMALQKEVNE